MASARIMVVEDEIVVAMELEKRLSALGYTVTGIVSTGEDAVERAGQVRPDFVLMDIKLAGRMDGIEAAEVIRERHDVPVVFLTAHTDDKTLQRAKLSEPFGYLVKPFSEAELRTTIEVSLHKHQQDKKSRESARWFTTILNVLDGAVIVTDEKGIVKHMNALAETLTGWKALESVGKPLEDVYMVRDRTTGFVVRDVLGLYEGEGAASPPWDLTLISRQETEIPIKHSVLPLIDPGGKVSVVTICFQEAALGIGEAQDWFSHAANLYLAARMCQSEGQYSEAEVFYRRALSIIEKVLGSDHPKIAAWLEDLSEVYRGLGRLNEAKMLDLRAERIRSNQPQERGEPKH